MNVLKTAVASALLAGFVLAAPTAQAQSERQFDGQWQFAGTIDLLGVDPGAQRFVGRTLSFRHGRVEGPFPFGCEEASYEALTVPPQGLFFGLLEAENPVQVAERFDVPMQVETLRVTCEIGTFDYHRTGTRMMTMLDGVVHVLTRQQEL